MTTSGAPRPPIEVFAFGPAWGIPIPSPSPFGLKLLTWMRMYEVPYVLRIANNPGQGPKKKSPWAKIDGQLIGDSELIIARLKASAGRDLDQGLSPRDRGVALSVQRMLEDHYHQVWEHQLFILDAAWERGKEFFDQLPPVVRVLVRTLVRGDLRKQLHARGVGRHSDDEIAAMGIADLEAIDALLGDNDFFFGDAPTDIDATVFGFLAVTYYIPSPSRVFEYLRSRPRLTAYCDRMLQRYFAGDAAA